MNSQFVRIANNAVFRFSSEAGSVDYLTAFEKLFLTLSTIKQYTVVDYDQIKEDFHDFYGLELKKLFVQEFINRLSQSGYVFKNKTDNQKYFCRDKIASLHLDTNLEKIKHDIELFTNKFLAFLQERNPDTTKEICETLICKCIEHTICSLSLKDLLIQDTINPMEKFIFDSFLKEIKENDDQLFSIYKKMMFSRLYTAVIAQNDISNNNLFVFNKLKVFLDSGFVFNALGMNYYVEKDEYIELLNELKKMGASLFIFKHTFIEMKDIIESSIQWIDNKQYDQYFASKTATFFVLSKFSKSDAYSLLYDFENKLKSINIQVYEEIDINYDNPEGIEITNLLNNICEDYKKKNTFDEGKYEAYQNDAKSIFFIHKLRKRNLQKRFSDVEFIFITNNSTIAKAAIDFNKEHYSGVAGIPCALTDSLLSTLVWFESNSYKEQDNLMFLIPSVYHAFEPSLSLLEKMNYVFKILKENGEMSEGAIHEWKTDSAYQKCIISYTQNNPDNFDENTPGNILKQLKSNVSLTLSNFVHDYEEQRAKIMKRIKIKKFLCVFILFIVYLAIFAGLYFLLDLIIKSFRADYIYLSIIIDGILLAISTLLSFINFNNKNIAKKIFVFCDSKIFNRHTYKYLERLNGKINQAQTIINGD